jgi:hypothetical protein
MSTEDNEIDETVHAAARIWEKGLAVALLAESKDDALYT